MDTEAIVVDQTYNAPVALVWKALTEKRRMRQWFFESITDFEPEPGFETRFDVHVDGQNYSHLWKVTEVVPEKRLAYAWRYEGLPGNSSVRWELSETLDGTKLRLTHEGHETFPRDNPVFSREMGEAGWGYLLRESLKNFLERQDS